MTDAMINLYSTIQQENSTLNSPQVSLTAAIQNDECFKINLNTRQIEIGNTLFVDRDHFANTMYFQVDRYFDDVDLASMTCVVEYINGENEGRIYPVLLKDTSANANKIYFAWCLGYEATKKAGALQFCIRFYKIDQTTKTFEYNLRTLPAEYQILQGMDKLNLGQNTVVDPVSGATSYTINNYSSNEIEQLFNAVTEAGKIYWTDV